MRVSRRLFVIDRPVIHRPVVHVGVLHVATFRVTTGRRRFVGLKIYDTRHTLFNCNIVHTKRYIISKNLNKNSKNGFVCARTLVVMSFRYAGFSVGGTSGSHTAGCGILLLSSAGRIAAITIVTCYLLRVKLRSVFADSRVSEIINF